MQTQDVETITSVQAIMLKHLRHWLVDVEGITNCAVNPSTFNLPPREKT